MQKIEIEQIRRWTTNNKASFPAVVPTHCPHCMNLVVFALSYPNYDAKRRAINHSAKCPACDETVNFTTHNNDEKTATALYMFPECSDYRETVHTAEQLPKPLFLAYQSVINSLNSQNYSSTANGCSRALEICLNKLTPDSPNTASLEDLLASAASKSSLSESLSNLAQLVRPGGNLRQYFDMELEPNKEQATAMVDLVEDLISYLFTLPSDIEALERQLKGTQEQTHPPPVAQSQQALDAPKERDSNIRKTTLK